MKKIILFLFFVPYMVSSQSPILVNTIDQEIDLERRFKESIQKQVDAVQALATDTALDELTWRLTVHRTKIVQIADNIARKKVSIDELIKQIKSHDKESYTIKIVCADIMHGQLHIVYYKIQKRNE